jgi:hypothetical protein
MELVVADNTEDHCFPLHACHDFLPVGRTLRDIGQFSHMMDFEVALPLSAVFTYFGVEPLYEFGTAMRKDAGLWDKIGYLLRRWVSWDVLQ